MVAVYWFKNECLICKGPFKTRNTELYMNSMCDKHNREYIENIPLVPPEHICDVFYEIMDRVNGELCTTIITQNG